MESILKVGIAQMAPVWLDRKATTEKIIEYIRKAAFEKCRVVVFGESLLPGYPFWIDLTNGATFNDQVQKELHAHYVKNSVNIESGDLKDICRVAADNRISIYLGIIERPDDRGGHSVYAALVYINELGEIKSVHIESLCPLMKKD